jgi:uncharacterized DUF497 family protein
MRYEWEEAKEPSKPTGFAIGALLVDAYREDYYGEEIIRIISARAAEKAMD